ncbi:hypothetical protein BH09PSE4_BH09PSE4_05920 [soil metagenome]
MLYPHALFDRLVFTVGLPIVSLWLLPLALIALVLAGSAGVTRIWFYRLAIFAFPFALAVLHSGNVGHPRYYLIASVALLVMLGEAIGRGLKERGWKLWASGVAFTAILAGCAVQDADLIGNQRGDPGAAIRAMAARSPGGARVSLERDTGLALLEAAAANARYRLAIVSAPCPAERFLFSDRFKGESFPAIAERCGRSYAPIAGARAHGLSGTHWTLYEIRPS